MHQERVEEDGGEITLKSKFNMADLAGMIYCILHMINYYIVFEVQALHINYDDLNTNDYNLLIRCYSTTTIY